MIYKVENSLIQAINAIISEIFFTFSHIIFTIIYRQVIIFLSMKNSIDYYCFLFYKLLTIFEITDKISNNQKLLLLCGKTLNSIDIESVGGESYSIHSSLVVDAIYPIRSYKKTISLFKKILET